MLELNDKTIFLEAGSYPLADSGHWCFAGEITDVEFLMRLRLVVSDVNSSAKGLVVAWYLDNEDQDALVKIYQQCKRGYTIFILDPLPHQFRDGTQGFRLETADTVKVGNLYIRHCFDNDTIYNLDKIVPASYAKCLELEIFIRSPKDRCLNCGAQSTDGKPLQKCGHCSVARYDSKICQTAHWKSTHKPDCKAVRRLKELLDMEDILESKNTGPIAFPPTDFPTRVPPAPAASGVGGKPTMMLLTLGDPSMFEDIEKHLITELSKVATPQKANTVEVALRHLASGKISCVLVTDAGIMEKRHKKLAERLVAFVRDAGGRVIFGCQFSSFVRPNDLAKFFLDVWGLPWSSGSYHRTVHALKPTRSTLLKQDNFKLAASYSLKALHLKGIQEGDAVYGPTEQSATQSQVFPASPLQDFTEAPIVFRKLGTGYVGYIGDVNAEHESTWVILAMLGLKA